MRYCFKNHIAGRKADLDKKEYLVVSGRALNGASGKIQIVLISNAGMAYGKVIELSEEAQVYKIPIEELKPVEMVTMPRPYPSFLPYYFERSASEKFEINDIETLQISIGSGLSAQEKLQPQKVGIRAVWLE